MVNQYSQHCCICNVYVLAGHGECHTQRLQTKNKWDVVDEACQSKYWAAVAALTDRTLIKAEITEEKEDAAKKVVEDIVRKVKNKPLIEF